MEGRKTKYDVVREVFHYIFLVLLAGFAVLSFIYRDTIGEYFAKELTSADWFNQILHLVPTLILSIQIIVLAIAVNMVVKLLSKLSFGFTSKGKTLVNILNSLIKWILIIVAILWILAVWGVDVTTLLASAGILALVIGLGAQSLIADILAGIFIVLEGEYVVGDIVIIDGWRGKIVNIGIRTTQLEDIGGNVKIINNSEIKSVINQTKHKSVANCSINVASNVRLEYVENLLKQEFENIKTKIPAISGKIEYKGVTNITDISITLLITADCYEEDLYQVQRDLNRELKLTLDKNGVNAFATPAIKVENDKKSNGF